MNNSRPNVIVFFTDQQRWDTTGAHGNPLGLTPNFDRAARQGTHLYNLFTCQPVCGPARSCLQSGRYATETGCFRNDIPLPDDPDLLAHQFRNAGYDTGYIGKWHLASQDPVPPEERGGYDYWLASNTLEFSSDAYDTVMFDKDGRPVKLPGYRADALTDAAIRYLDRHRERPFFLFLSYLEPHHQNHLDSYPAPDGYEEAYVAKWTPPDLASLGGSAPQHLGGYCGMVKRLDEAFGRLLDALKSLALDERTIVLFASDHGCHFKTRNEEYKRSCHDSSIRVPGAVIGPGFAGGGQIRSLISLIDVPPTLLDAAGIPVPPAMRGRSFLPLAQKRPTAWPREAFVQISESQVGRAIRTERWKYGAVAPDKDPYKDAGADRYVEQYLYDLHADPHELTNLAGIESYGGISAELRDRLLLRMREAGEAQARIEPAPLRPGGQRRISIRS